MRLMEIGMCCANHESLNFVGNVHNPTYTNTYNQNYKTQPNYTWGNNQNQQYQLQCNTFASNFKKFLKKILAKKKEMAGEIKNQ